MQPPEQRPGAAQRRGWHAREQMMLDLVVAGPWELIHRR